MPGDLGRGGPLAERINWSASVLLNLVIQAGFELTVATCRCGQSCRTHMNFIGEKGGCVFAIAGLCEAAAPSCDFGRCREVHKDA